MAWKYVQYDNGKYRTTEQGGGGSSTLAGLDDVSLSSPTNGQVLKYNSTSQEWENANETGGAVSSVNGQTGDVVLDADDVGALPDSTTIPSALSDLSDDSTHRVVTDTEKSTWNNKSDFSGSYNDLTDQPTIPGDTKVTQENTTESKDYRVLLSGTNDDGTKTEGAHKSTNLKFNPNVGDLQTLKLNGVTIGNSPVFTDANVTQTATVTDEDYEVLFSGTADNTTRTEGVKKSDGLLYNARWKNLQTHKVTLRKIVSQIDDALIVTAGHTDNDVHYPEKWTDDTSTTREQGGRIVIKMPTNGHENGIFLSINNGINYSPIALQNNALRDEYPSNMFVELIYDEYGSISTYPLNGGKSKLDVTGIWRVLSVINYDHQVTQNNTSENYSYRVLLSGSADDVTRREEVNKSSSLKFNPSTGNLQATQLNGTNISDIIKFHVGTYSGSVNQYGNLSLGSDYTGKTILGASVDNALTYVCVGKNTSGGNMLAFRQIQTDAKLANGTAVSGYVFYSD